MKTTGAACVSEELCREEEEEEEEIVSLGDSRIERVRRLFGYFKHVE